MATALTPQTDVTSGKSHVTDGEPETVVSASLQKIKSIKNPIKHFLFLFYFIKSETSDSFVNHFDGHFAYLKTLDFYFNLIFRERVLLLCATDSSVFASVSLFANAWATDSAMEGMQYSPYFLITESCVPCKPNVSWQWKWRRARCLAVCYICFLWQLC